MGCCGWRNVRRDDVLMIRIAEVSSVWRLFIGCLVRLGEFWSVMSGMFLIHLSVGLYTVGYLDVERLFE